MPGETITIDEIKTLIKEEKIKPSRLFGMDDLAEDPVIKGIVKEEVDNAVTAEYTHRKRVDKRFDGDKEEWEKEKKKLEDENKELRTESAKVKAADLFSTKAKERKLDKKQIEFIGTKQGDFTPENVDELDKEVDRFMDTKLEEFKKTAEIFGHKTEVKTETEAEKKGGGEPGEGGSDEDNELIPD